MGELPFQSVHADDLAQRVGIGLGPLAAVGE
jgi:hypothetical protein